MSADGISAYLTQLAIPNPIMHRSQLVVVASAEMHDTTYGGVERGGAYNQDLISGWLTGIGEPAFITNVTDNEAFSAWWANDTMTGKWNHITCPAIHYAGWYDIFSQQQLDAFNAYQTESTLGQGDNIIFVSPGGHCPGGQVVWPGALDGVAIALQLAIVVFKALSDPEVTSFAPPNVNPINW